MNKDEYERLQEDISKHLKNQKLYGRMNSKEKDIYEKAILSVKSIISNYKEG
jgi:hypothetical protein